MQTPILKLVHLSVQSIKAYMEILEILVVLQHVQICNFEITVLKDAYQFALQNQVTGQIPLASIVFTTVRQITSLRIKLIGFVYQIVVFILPMEIWMLKFVHIFALTTIGQITLLIYVSINAPLRQIIMLIIQLKVVFSFAQKEIIGQLLLIALLEDV